MSKAFFHGTLMAAVTLGMGGTLSAQGITVQEPVVQVFSVNTTVSVPDRGAAYLGGVSSAAQGSSMYGPLPYSSSGLTRTNSGMEIGVYIHDFDAMDRYLLSQSTGADQHEWVNPNRRAAAAFEVLRGDNVAFSSHPHSYEMSADRPGDSAASGGSRPSAANDSADGVEFCLARARDAEQRGRSGLASLWYQTAARHGSRLAEQKLRELGQQ